MRLYDRFVLPRVIDAACGTKPIAECRASVVPRARGRVLEIGAGSGLNLPFYQPWARELIALEPSAEMWSRAAERVAASVIPVQHLHAGAESIPLEDDSVDTVVVTFTLCTIPDPARALEEFRRVLKPEGTLLFAEHGRAPDPGVLRWQRRLNPIWRRLAGGCHLDRDVPALLDAAGFGVQRLRAEYSDEGPRFAGFHYVGAARPTESLAP